MPSGIVDLFDKGWINGLPQLINFITVYYYHGLSSQQLLVLCVLTIARRKRQLLATETALTTTLPFVYIYFALRIYSKNGK